MKTFDLAGAMSDIAKGFALWRVWWRLGLDDLMLRYSRTRLGPFWMTVSLAIYVGGLGLVWGTIFNIDLAKFFPYMAIGLIVWQFLSGTVGEAGQAFITSNGIIQEIPLPLSLHIDRQVLRMLITLFHTVPVAIAVTLFAGVDYTAVHLLVIPALIILAINCWWVTFLLAIVGLRYRDIGQAIGTFMPFMFFFTPILWKKEMLGRLGFIADINPFTHYLEILRQPFLGNLPPAESVWTVIVMTTAGLLATLIVFARTRHRIAFWV